MAPSTAIFISLPSPFLKVINCNHLHLCYGALVVGCMLRSRVTVYLLETYHVKPAVCLSCLWFTILLERNLPFLNVIDCNHLVLCYSVLVVGSLLRCTCGWLFVTVYLWLTLCYCVLVVDSLLLCTCGWIFVTVYLLLMYYVKPYHLPIIYYLVYGVMSTIRIWETKVMMSWSMYGS